MTLTEFLLARIAEHESLILYGWDSDGEARIATMWTGGEPGYTTVASDHGDDDWVANGREVEDPRHLKVLFDPAHVLAECEAKRRIVEMKADEGEPHDYANGYDSCQLDVLHLLALPYADHPDYDKAWS